MVFILQLPNSIRNPQYTETSYLYFASRGKTMAPASEDNWPKQIQQSGAKRTCNDHLH